MDDMLSSRVNRVEDYSKRMDIFLCKLLAELQHVYILSENLKNLSLTFLNSPSSRATLKAMAKVARKARIFIFRLRLFTFLRARPPLIKSFLLSFSETKLSEKVVPLDYLLK